MADLIAAFLKGSGDARYVGELLEKLPAGKVLAHLKPMLDVQEQQQRSGQEEETMDDGERRIKLLRQIIKDGKRDRKRCS